MGERGGCASPAILTEPKQGVNIGTKKRGRVQLLTIWDEVLDYCDAQNSTRSTEGNGLPRYQSWRGQE